MGIERKLLNESIVKNNSYFIRYCQLINNNKLTIKERDKTQNHHIIPRCYFKHFELPLDRSKENLVVLSYENHILAHYYLYKCAKQKWFKIKNMWAVSYLSGIFNKLDDIQIKNISWDEIRKCRKAYINCMKNQEIKNKHDAVMRDKITRDKISRTMKKRIASGQFFTDSHRKKLSQSSKGQVRINKDGIYTHVKSTELQKYLDNGWKRGGPPLSESHKQALINSHIGKKYSEESRRKMSLSHLGKSPANKGIPLTEIQKEKIRNKIRNRRLMSNGEIKCYVSPEDFITYQNNGYVFVSKKYKKEVVL